jgi:hypothetical protein
MPTRTITKNSTALESVMLVKCIIDALRKEHSENFPLVELVNLEIASDCLADVMESWAKRPESMQEVTAR